MDTTRTPRHLRQPKSYAKATVGAVIAGLAATATALGDGTLSPLDGVMIASAAVVAFEGIFWTKNEPTEPN
jgi:hypothetical protein